MVDPRYPEPGSNDDNNRQWTVLIYMAGDNNLSEECVYSLIEAKEALTDYHNKLAVLAQFDPSGVLAETKRYLLRSKEKPLEKDAEKTGWKASETNTGEPHNLLEFLRWGMSSIRLSIRWWCLSDTAAARTMISCCATTIRPML
jgi:hypothetical protein